MTFGFQMSFLKQNMFCKNETVVQIYDIIVVLYLVVSNNSIVLYSTTL